MGVKFNPFTGKFDLVSVDPENFSYNYIEVSKTLIVPTNQQMLVYDSLTIDGVLTIDGEAVLIDFKAPSRIKTTEETETINIEIYEVIRQTVSGITTSLSNAITGSTITITNRSGGDNTLNITIQGTASPIIKDLESFSLIYNGTDYDIT